MTYNEQIKALIDEVRPQFELLGIYAFHGEGEPEEVTNAFVNVADAYMRAKELTQETFGSADLKPEEGSMWCGDGVNDDDEELVNTYDFASEAGYSNQMANPDVMKQVIEASRKLLTEAKEHQSKDMLLDKYTLRFAKYIDVSAALAWIAEQQEVE